MVNITHFRRQDPDGISSAQHTKLLEIIEELNLKNPKP
jgi:hypothetical protein